jgi:hypothetical protein
MHTMHCVAIIGAVTAITFVTTADLVIDDANGLILDVTTTTGTGSSTAYFVIDFNFTGGDSYAFAYSFDGDATAHDAFLAFGDLGLSYIFDDYGEWGIFANNFAWDGDIGDVDNYWAHSLATPDGSGVVDWSDAMSSVDTTSLTDGLLSGWYNGFNEDYSAIVPTLPLTAVPAPGVLALFGLSLCVRRRRR